MMRLCLIWLNLVSLLAVITATVGVSQGMPEGFPRSFAFAVIGDDPYYKSDIEKFERLMVSIKKEELAFAVHLGDFKHDDGRGCLKSAQTGSQCLSRDDPAFKDRILGCDRPYYEKVRDWLTDESRRLPFVLIFGDNDWLECPSPNFNDPRLTEREAENKLNELRDVFITHGRTYAETIEQKLQPVRQLVPENPSKHCPKSTLTGYPEHMRWMFGGIVFVTLNVLGYGDQDQYRGKEDDDEFTRRECAYKQWLEKAFEEARGTNVRAVVIFIQGSPLLETPPGNVIRYGFNGFTNVLAGELSNFSKPVLLVHGDDHEFRVRIGHKVMYHSNGIAGPTVTTRQFPNLTEITVFGSPSGGWGRSEIPWTKFTVNPSSNGSIFFLQLMATQQ